MSESRRRHQFAGPHHEEYRQIRDRCESLLAEGNSLRAELARVTAENASLRESIAVARGEIPMSGVLRRALERFESMPLEKRREILLRSMESAGLNPDNPEVR